MSATAFDIAWEKVQQLAADFRANETHFLSPSYQEAEVRKDFIDKFWIALGWDVNHDTQKNPYEQEVKVEPSVAEGTARTRADYAFYLKPNFHDVSFFVEAKKPSSDLSDADSIFQTVRYGWNSGTPLAVLTNFHQFRVLDCRYRPKITDTLNRIVDRFSCDDYTNAETFAKIYYLFSHEAVQNRSLAKHTEGLPRLKATGYRRRLFKGRDEDIDAAFLEDLDGYRAKLAKAFKQQNPRLTSQALTEVTQRTLDRLVFTRFLEDKLIEPAAHIEKFSKSDTPWKDFIATSLLLDRTYNGIVYKPHAVLDDSRFLADDREFCRVCEGLGDPTSPYNFNHIPIHILGSIYERFLGNVISDAGRLTEKPEVRKAGGVYYTPEYIVRYIVENTVGKLIADKTPKQIAEMKFADIACGSGSFLLGVYDTLLRYHSKYYNEFPATARPGDCLRKDDGTMHLTLGKKREILLNNIYGVDLDAQAVEVAQLSLYLKLLEEETTASARQFLLDFEHRERMKQLLPDLSKNIVRGNSLIGRDITKTQKLTPDEEKNLCPMDFEDAFPQIFGRKPGVVREPATPYGLGHEGGRRWYPAPPEETHGFDAIVGNPPYRMLQPHNTTPNILAYLRSHYVTAEFKIDLFHLFLQRAASVLKDGGQLSYIVPTTILNNVYAEKLRGWLMNHCCMEQIAVARGRVFADADVHTSVLVFRREASEAKRENQEVLTTDQLSEDFTANAAFTSRTRQATFASLPGRVWNILVNDSNSSLIRRLTTDCEPLEKFGVINRGLITGDRDKYFAKTKATAQHVPILAGTDVHRYHTARASEFVLFRKPKTAGGCWDEAVHFAPHKLVVRQICEEPTANILTKPVAVTGNLFTVRADTVEAELYLLGIINSQLTSFFWRTMFADFKTSFPQVTIFSLAQVPIHRLDLTDPADKARHDEMVRLVEEMLAAKKELAKALMDTDKNFWANKCADLDAKIDRLVYDLYGLTEEEIAIVESEGKQQTVKEIED